MLFGSLYKKIIIIKVIIKIKTIVQIIIIKKFHIKNLMGECFSDLFIM